MPNATRARARQNTGPFTPNIMSNSSSSSSGGIGFLGLLAILFITLKLCGVISWSWWWVTAPLWGGFALFVAIFIVAAILAVVLSAFSSKRTRR